jgi:hypothetical protein
MVKVSLIPQQANLQFIARSTALKAFVSSLPTQKSIFNIPNIIKLSLFKHHHSSCLLPHAECPFMLMTFKDFYFFSRAFSAFVVVSSAATISELEFDGSFQEEL